MPYSRGLTTNMKFFFFQDGLLHIIFNHKWEPQNWKLPGKIVEIVKNGGIIYGKINIGVVASVKKKKRKWEILDEPCVWYEVLRTIYTYTYIV